jgi:predicted acylesterase/phospholipase RssA
MHPAKSLSNFRELGEKYVQPSQASEAHHERDSALLCTLLAKVNESVCSFRPSPSLANLDHSATEEIDVVVSGGGLKGYFLIGARSVLETQLSLRNLKIARVAGASAGAWSAMFIAVGISTADWMKTYTFTRAAVESGDSSRVLEAYREQILPWLFEKLPPDAYLRCNGRCFISITVLDKGYLPHNVIISEFTSNEDLVNACFASSCIPFVVERGFGPRFRGQRVVDGGLTNNTPCFTDGERRQIVFRLDHVPYDWRAIALPCGD